MGQTRAGSLLKMQNIGLTGIVDPADPKCGILSGQSKLGTRPGSAPAKTPAAPSDAAPGSPKKSGIACRK